MKVKGKVISTPALKCHAQLNHSQVKSLAGQESIYVRLNKAMSSSNPKPASVSATADTCTATVKGPSSSTVPIEIDISTDDFPPSVPRPSTSGLSAHAGTTTAAGPSDEKIFPALHTMFPNHSEGFLREVSVGTIDIHDAVDTVLSEGKGMFESNCTPLPLSFCIQNALEYFDTI